MPKAGFRGLGFLAFVLLLSIVSPSAVNAEQEIAEQTCESSNDWVDVEKETYRILCESGEANLLKSYNKRFFDEDLSVYDPPYGLRPNISAEFIKKILTEKKYTDILPKSLTIKGFTIDRALDLSLEKIDKELNFLDVTFLERLNFKNANFQNSLNFYGSSLHQGIDFEDGKVSGQLSFSGSKFGDEKNKPENKERVDLCSKNVDPEDDKLRNQSFTLINLRGVDVSKSLFFNGASIMCRTKDERLKLRNTNVPLDLKRSKIDVSVDLRYLEFKETSKEEEEKLPSVRLLLTASTIGDSLSLSNDKNNFNKRFYFDFDQVKAKALIIYTDGEQFGEINETRINKLLNFSNKPQPTPLPESLPVLYALNLNLDNSSFKTFLILPDTSDKLPAINKGASEEKVKEKDREACKTYFDGLNVTNLNESSYKFIFVCVDNLFRSSTNLAFDLTEVYKPIKDKRACSKDELKKSNKNKLEILREYLACLIKERIIINKESNKRLLELLSPLETLSIISQKSGALTVQREIQYRQKKLEFFITKTNFELAKMNIVKFFLRDEDGESFFREIGRAYISFGQLVSLSLQDLINGYGFYRENVFFILFYLFTINFFLALWIKHKKQQTLVIKSLYLKTREIKDENLHNICPDNQAKEGLESIRESIDTIERLVFHKAKTENGKKYFYLYYKLKDNGEGFKQIKLETKDFEYLINILDERNPHHTKVGFCRDYYPRGQWSVVTKPIFAYSSKEEVQTLLIFGLKIKMYKEITPNEMENTKKFMQTAIVFADNLVEINEISLYLINKSIEIKETQFDYLPLPMKVINWSMKSFFSPVRNTRPLQKPKSVVVVALLSTLVLLSIPVSLGFCFLLSGLIPVSLGNWTRRWFGFYLGIKYYFIFIIFVIILILVIDSWLFFEMSYQKETGGNHSYITKKNIENSLLFSLDILLPVIEIDKENQDFILNAAEDYRIIRTIFKLEKVVGPVLISLILPLLFITGL